MSQAHAKPMNQCSWERGSEGVRLVANGSGREPHPIRLPVIGFSPSELYRSNLISIDANEWTALGDAMAVALGVATKKSSGNSLTLEMRQLLHGQLGFTLGKNF